MSFPFDRIRHLLIDLDGVLYRGNTSLAGAAGFISWLRSGGITFRLVTNNSTLTRQQYMEKLARMGIAVATDEIFTSALATALYLQRECQSDRSAYVIGQEGLVDALTEIGMRLVADHPDWVIVGLDRTLTYEKLAIGSLALERGAGFLGTNPDTSFPTERGLEPGAGAILAALVATTGRKPTVIGKPHPLMLELAMEHMGGTSSDTAMLGDRLDTDIAAAAAAQVPSILVLTGVSTRQDVESSQFHPSLIVENLQQLMDTWPSGAPSPR